MTAVSATVGAVSYAADPTDEGFRIIAIWGERIGLAALPDGAAGTGDRFARRPRAIRADLRDLRAAHLVVGEQGSHCDCTQQQGGTAVTTSTREATRRAGVRERWTESRQSERLKDLLTAFGRLCRLLRSRRTPPTASVPRPFLEESLLWTALWTGYPAFRPPHVIDAATTHAQTTREWAHRRERSHAVVVAPLASRNRDT